MVIIGIVTCIITAGFFAGLETGLLSANQLSILSGAEKRFFFARAARFLLIDPERLLSITLIGTNISVVTATVLFKSLFTSSGVPGWAAWLGSFFLSMVLLIFSEIIPKSFFRQHADTISVKLAPVLVFFYFLFLPLAVLLNGIVSFILFLFRQKKVKRGPKSRSDLKLLIKLVSKEAGIPQGGQKIIDDIFDFKNTMAREVMIPYHRLPVCSLDSAFRTMINLFIKTRAQFIVIFKERADNVVGYVSVMDLLKTGEKNIVNVMKRATFYPETKKIPDLLLAMNKRKKKVVFLSDEYGGVSGMITPGEIASEIVGHIPGQKKNSQDIKKVARGTYEITGTADLEDVVNETGLHFDKGYYDTIGGYICNKLGVIPEKGMIFKEKGVSYEVLDCDERHVKKLRMVNNEL